MFNESIALKRNAEQPILKTPNIQNTNFTQTFGGSLLINLSTCEIETVIFTLIITTSQIKLINFGN